MSFLGQAQENLQWVTHILSSLTGWMQVTTGSRSHQTEGVRGLSYGVEHGRLLAPMGQRTASPPRGRQRGRPLHAVATELARASAAFTSPGAGASLCRGNCPSSDTRFPRYVSSGAPWLPLSTDSCMPSLPGFPCLCLRSLLSS